MKNKRFSPGLLLLLAGVGFILAGMARAEHLTVLRKAVLICLECVGIG